MPTLSAQCTKTTQLIADTRENAPAITNFLLAAPSRMRRLKEVTMKKREPVFALFYAAVSLGGALFLFVHIIMKPEFVGPLFFIGLALTCLLLALGSHYFHHWKDRRLRP